MGDNLMGSDNRPHIYREGSKYIVRFSGSGACTKILVAHLLGHEPEPPPDWMLKKFEEGHNAEPHIIKAVAHGKAVPNVRFRILPPDDNFWFKYKVGISYGQWECEVPLTADIWARGKLDGIAETHTTPIGLEFPKRVCVEAKAFGPYYWERFKKGGLDGVPHYKSQVALEMYATDLPCLFVVGEKDEDGELTGEYAYELVIEPPMSLGEIRGRVAKAVALARINEEQPEGFEQIQCDPKQFPCPFYYLHGDDEEWVKDGMPENVEVDVREEVIAAYLEAKRQQTEAEQEVKRIRGLLLEAFGDVERGVAHIGDYKISKTPVPIKEHTVKAHTQYRLTVK